MKRDYYLVVIPKDLTEDLTEAGQHAITEAEERTRIWAMPATWTATCISSTPSNHLFRVKRERN